MNDNILNTSADLREVLENMSNAITSTTRDVSKGVTNNTPEGESEDDMDEYIARFDRIQTLNDIGNSIIGELNSSEHDQARVEALCKYVVHLQNQCTEMYTLLVEMNNIFGK